MAKPKGLPKSGGRKKGTPNKVTGAVKDMVLEALAGVGGVKYLKQQAQDNPTAFLTLVGKVIPTQVSGDPDNPMRHLFGWLTPSDG
jgi:hypothetical protein